MSPRIIDISRTISSNAVVYPGDAPLTVKRTFEIGPECPCNITQLGWSTHFLTHVDPPLHFVRDGASLDNVPLDRFVCDVMVTEVAGDVVLPLDVPPSDGEKRSSVLFKTRNSRSWDLPRFDGDHVYISAKAADVIAARGFNLVGIDYLSVDRFGDESYPAHRTLLENGVLILEGIDLSHVAEGRYTLIALPLKIAGGDGSPVRAVLFPL